MGYIDEVPVVQVFRYAVSTPCAATHALREIQPAGKAAAIAEGVRLID